ncbi:hypothetical protein [Cellulosilyticum sp. I15G10I2]|nr:hypothetical protein [Cellulosilyticum sp. I15G10I2]
MTVSLGDGHPILPTASLGDGYPTVPVSAKNGSRHLLLRAPISFSYLMD